MDDFSASYDRTTKIVSALACALLAIPAATINHIGVRIVSVLVMLVSYGYSPRSYSFADGAVVIKRLIGNVRVPLDGVREARRAGPGDLAGCIRLWGSGGLFGYYGWFRTPQLGTSKWYVTDRSKAIVLRTDDRTVLVSPDEPDRFLDRIRAWAPAALSSANEVSAASARLPKSLKWALGLAGAGLGVVVLGTVAAVLLYAPGPPSYSLTREALTIHDRFYPATVYAGQVDVSRIRVIDFKDDAEWRPILRTNGFGSLHYHSGWFRAANGRTVRMYRADGKRLVLLPPKGDAAAVLYEVNHPDQLVHELLREWAGQSY